MKKMVNKNVWLGVQALLLFAATLIFTITVIGCEENPDPNGGGKTIHLAAQHYGYNDEVNCGEQWMLLEKIKLSDITNEKPNQGDTLSL